MQELPTYPLEKGSVLLPAKMEAEVDTLCLLIQPKGGQQQI